MDASARDVDPEALAATPRTAGWQRALAALLLLTTGVLVFWVPGPTIHASWTGLIRQSDPDLDEFRAYQATFNSGEHIGILVEGPPKAVQRDCGKLLAALGPHPGVSGAIGPTPLAQPEGTFHESGLAVVFVELMADPPSPFGPDDLKTLVTSIETPDGVSRTVGGSIFQERVLAQVVSDDLLISVPLVFVSLLLITVLLLRSIRAAISLGIVLGPTLLITLGVHGVLYGQLTTVTALLAPIVLTVGAATVVHYLARVRGIAARTDVTTARRVHMQAARTCLLAAGTTAAGFLALLSIRIPEFDKLAIIGTLGCLTAGIAVAVLLPVAQPLLGTPRRTGLRVGTRLKRLAVHDLDDRGRVFWIVTLVFLGVGGFALNISTSTNILEDLPDDSEMRRISELAYEKLGGSGELDLCWRGAENFATDEGLARIEAAGAAIQAAVPESAGVLSEATALRILQGEEGALRWNEAQARLLHKGSPLGRVPQLISKDGTQTRFLLRLPGIGSTEEFLDFCTRAEGAMAPLLRPGESFLATGTPYLISNSTQAVVTGQGLACLLSILVVSILAALVFRCWRVMPLIWIPNVLPLLTMVGVLGLTGTPISAATAVAGSVVFGLIVDDTLHFIAHLKAEAKAGRGAPRRALIRLTPAFVATSIVLVSGSAYVMFSPAKPVALFSRLMVLGVLLALVLDLFLTPRLAAWLRPFGTGRTPGAAAPRAGEGGTA